MFALNIVTPDKKLLADAEMEEVFVPAFRGELNIFPNHSPLVSTLTEGVLKYRLKGESETHAVAISWGYIEITPNGVNILAETAESKEEIDLGRAKKALDEAQKLIESADVTPDDIINYQAARRRAEARINVAEGKTLH